jgi:hypothetical protein
MSLAAIVCQILKQRKLILVNSGQRSVASFIIKLDSQPD